MESDEEWGAGGKAPRIFKFGIGCSLLVSLILPNILQGGAVTPCPKPNMRITHCRLFVTSGYLYCSYSEFAEATVSLASG